LLFVLAGRSAAAAFPGHIAVHFSIADFDGDSRPDFASVDAGQINSRLTRYWVAFRLSGGASRNVAITAPTGGLQIALLDVNGDTFPDVIVTTAWTNTPVAILLNDGYGNFTTSSPAEFQNAFASCGVSWTLAVDEIRDLTAILIARYDPGDCRPECGSLSASKMLSRIAARSFSESALNSVAPFTGRAPPHRYSL
jgi:hypothetical protein